RRRTPPPPPQSCTSPSPMPSNTTLTLSPCFASSRPHHVPVVTTVPRGTVSPWRVACRSHVGSSHAGSPSECVPRKDCGAPEPICTTHSCCAQSRGAYGFHVPSTRAPCDCRSASLS